MRETSALLLTNSHAAALGLFGGAFRRHIPERVPRLYATKVNLPKSYGVTWTLIAMLLPLSSR